jgi:hypothetical protein
MAGFFVVLGYMPFAMVSEYRAAALRGPFKLGYTEAATKFGGN